MTEALLLERPSSDIVVLKLHRPQVRNALNLELRTRLADVNAPTNEQLIIAANRKLCNSSPI